MRVAIATCGDKGLQDVVAPDFGRSRTFTIVEIEDGKIKSVETVNNPAENLQRKKGPTIARMLANKNVSAVISGNIGPGASGALEQFGIRVLIVKPGLKVEEVLREQGLIT
ncbi:MAG: NifB/NifX family molybdenum-iron cluster-binding protein [Thaumarchaeota archaeon]|jgi:predicted Fe-Mo cluster-binding NifX family protein|nr:NifB/NifX family molybdenum-iron cluster-binding protein [Candidatus Terraquivivens yellowstonensis]